jgi:anti-sigma factor RsiW
MDKLSDEMITAWLDGEVTQQQRSEIEAAIAASPELGVRVARLSCADRLLAPAFAETLNAPIPERFEAVIGRSRRGDGLVSFRAALSGLLSPRPMAMAAASLVVGVMLGGAVLSGSPTDAAIATDSQGRMIASDTMAASLASVVSGANAGPLAIRLSFVDSGGRYCRQFETTAAAGLACLESESWVIDTLSGMGGTPSLSGAYVMAGGSTDIAISAAIERLGIQRVLDSHEEAAAMASGWAASAD